LHEFRIGERRFGRPDWEDDFMGQTPSDDERRFRLRQVFAGIGSQALYVYDFGDNWEHDISVEEIFPPDPGHRYPFCSDGWGKCPPEDCGGAPAYEHLVRAMEDRYHPERRELVRWMGGKFDPADFSIDRVNRKLARKFRPVRRT